jgi:hypothetical protein
VSTVIRRFSLGLVLLGACGCIDRTRLNSTCAWTHDSAFPLDLANPAHRRHLVADAQLAEGLAVRYADTEHKRRSGYGGHGGLLEYGGVLHQCFDPLVARIERDHGVTAAQIREARPVRDARFDAAVLLSFAVVYLAASLAAVRWIRRRFVDASGPMVGFVLTVAAAAFGVLGVQLGAVWSAICESARIGDDHFGMFRATRSPLTQHVAVAFAVAVGLFWLAALAYRRLRPSEPYVPANQIAVIIPSRTSGSSA